MNVEGLHITSTKTSGMKEMNFFSLLMCDIMLSLIRFLPFIFSYITDDDKVQTLGNGLWYIA